MSNEIKFGEYSLLNNELFNNPECNDSSCKFIYPCSDKQTCSGFKIQLKPGHYLFEVYGAQGSQDNSYTSASHKGSLGGYARAEITIRKKIPLYLFIGSQGDWTDEGPSGKSFNGGGPGYNSGPGGGATDFRMFENETHSRFLIAGGGGAQGLYHKIISDDDSSTGGGPTPNGGGGDPTTDPGDDPTEEPSTDPTENPTPSTPPSPFVAIKNFLEFGIISNPGGYGGGDFGANGSLPEITGGTQSAPGGGFQNGTFGNGCKYHNFGAHGGSGGGLFGGGCGKDNGASGAGGSGFVYSNQKPTEINEIKDIDIQNGNLSYGINRGDGFARITLLSPIKLTDYLYNLKNKKIKSLTVIIFLIKK